MFCVCINVCILSVSISYTGTCADTHGAATHRAVRIEKNNAVDE